MNIYRILLVILSFLCVSGCKKDWLEVKRDQSLSIPHTLEDMQQLLDNLPIMNGDNSSAYSPNPALGQLASDEYYLIYSNWQSASSTIEKNNYIWAQDIYTGQPLNEWLFTYRVVFYSNVVLEGLGNINVTSQNSLQFKNIKGAALFYRAFAFYQLSQLFAKLYVSSTADEDLGIPLRLQSDPNVITKRSTLKQTYDQIIADLRESIILLSTTPSNTPISKSRPSKQAGYGMLARTFLSMSDYNNAKIYSDSCLYLYNKLIDFNTVKASASLPFSSFGDEVIFHATLNAGGYRGLSATQAIVDSNLIALFDADDLRGSVYFGSLSNNMKTFKGSFANNRRFAGIATDEIYLIRAECFARNNMLSEALGDLNLLLKSRWKKDLFTSFETADPQIALDKILLERRKELIFRGTRWTDLRRLNREQRYAITLKRDLNGEIYSLPPNDARYVLPIPDDVISKSGISQNER